MTELGITPELPPQPPEPTTAPKTPRRHLATAGYASLIVGVLLITAALGYQTWRTNEDARASFAHDSTSEKASGGSGPIADGTPPSEAAVPEETKKAYSVAADMPRMIHIDRIGVHARVLRMSVTTSGAVQAPAGIWDAGWYDGSAKPGEPGTAFIDGHVSGPTMDAVFVKLKVLRAGDFITIERGDSSTITYSVASVSTNKLEDIDMKQVLATSSGGKQQLTLMTCGGDYQGNYNYDSRVIVVAERL